MSRNPYIALLSAFLLLPIVALASNDSLQDTIPPIFTKAPRDTTIRCNTPIENILTTWYTSQAGAQADNGNANVVAELSLQSVLDSMTQVLEGDCNETYTLTLGFFALDSCNLRSEETLFADFKVEDKTKPIFDIPAENKDVICSAGVKDSLQSWLDQYGGAQASDDCSETVTWTSYIWTDDLNNSGFSEIAEPTNIVIQRINCSWSVDVSFFVEDECGNDNVTTATFTISSDGEAPFIELTPPDSLLQCGVPFPIAEPMIRDACDGLLELTVRDSTNRINDIDSCGYYNYESVRIWTAVDACNNIIETRTKYTYLDTLAPEILFEGVVVTECNSDLDDYSRFIEVADSCSHYKVTFQDSSIASTPCQTQISREWTVSDICENESSVTQIIQAQDFSGPEFIIEPKDTIVSCSTNEIESLFIDWRNRAAGAQIQDDCNSFETKVLPRGTYSDTSTINLTSSPELSIRNCDSTDSLGFISNQSLTLVAYDICGNITQQDILFSIIDNNPPSIPDCPQDFFVTIDDNQCETAYSARQPSFSDNCLTPEQAEWMIFVNGDSRPLPTNGLITNLPIGENSLVYLLTDCGSNQVSCEQIITVSDASPPSITCIADTLIFIADECHVDFQIPPLLSYEDNCTELSGFNETQPPGDGYLVFNYNSFGNIYQAFDDIFSFVDQPDLNSINTAFLSIRSKVNLQEESTIIIRDEDENNLIEIGEGMCIENTFSIPLSISKINKWFEDGSLDFTIIHKSDNNFGTIPCEPQNLSGNRDTDESSILQLTLSYTEINAVADLSVIESEFNDPIIGDTILTAGTYVLNYEVRDDADNSSICVTNIEVVDALAPELNCADFTYILDPLLIGFYPLIESQLDFTAVDNCLLERIEFEPKQLFCNQSNEAIAYEILAYDIYENVSRCAGNIDVETAALEPSFLSSLCLADTLKLFSNLDIGLGLTIEWTGPGGFSTNQNNPVITGISEETSGTYTLSATNVEGCIFEGHLEIDVNEFDSPIISTTTPTLCVGSNLLLNATSFTELVEYFWYEGVSPNGTLIGQTLGPSLSVSPTLGEHFYYVEVNGNDCNSRPSNTLQIDVREALVAEISQPFISICEGNQIALSTDILNPDFEYTWTGPNNYSSSGQFPEIIQNATQLNQGIYTLVIDDGICESDSASAQVIVFSRPDLPIITGESVFCEGQSAVLTVPNIPNGTRYQWYLNGVFYNAVSSNSLLIPSISTSLAGEWTVIVEEGICSSEVSENFTVNVERSLSIGATNNGPHCEGDSVVLTSSFIPAATYTWEDPRGMTFDGRIITVLAEQGIYTVTVNTLSNCSATTTTQVEVNQKPQITALSNTSLPCMSGTTPITFVPTVFPAGAYEYIWEGPNGFISSMEQPVITNASEVNNGIYTLKVRLGNCESDPITTDINITVLPEPGELQLDKIPCIGDEIKISILNPVTSANVNWTWSTPLGQIVTDDPELNITDFNVNDSGNYSVIQESNGCQGPVSEVLTIELLSEKLLPLLSVEDTYCEGEEVTISVSNISAGEFTWFTPQGILVTSENILDLGPISFADAGSYQVHVMDGNCNSDTSDVKEVIVNSSAETPSISTKIYEVCLVNEDSLTICIDNTGLDLGQLQLIETNTGIPFSESDTECFTLKFSNTNQNDTYTLELINLKDGCPSINNDTIVINTYGSDIEPAQFQVDSIFICDKTFANISIGDIPDGVTTTWKVDNPEINLFIESPTEVALSNLQSGTSQLILTSSNGICESFFSDTLVIENIGILTADDDIIEGSFNEEIEISPLLNDLFSSDINIEIVSGPENGTGRIEGTNIIYGPDIGFIGDEVISYQICYTSCPEICSQANLILKVGNDIDCFIGTIITPNNDGYNDRLIAPCLSTGRYPDSELTIVNQYGDEIFNASPYMNDWDGRYNGKTLPDGTYFYILRLDDENDALNGYIIIEN